MSSSEGVHPARQHLAGPSVPAAVLPTRTAMPSADVVAACSASSIRPIATAGPRPAALLEPTWRLRRTMRVRQSRARLPRELILIKVDLGTAGWIARRFEIQ